MTDFVDVPKDTLLLWLREKKAPIPAKLNRNKEELSVKAIFVETENKFALFLVCGDCEKVFCWYKQQSGGKWINLSGLSTVKLHQPDEEEIPEQVVKKRKISIRPTLLAEIDEFRESWVPMRDPIGFWKFSKLARLKVCAKLILSVPVSSVGIERLFSEAGMLLTKQRKRMLPKVVKNLIYIRYEKKYRK